MEKLLENNIIKEDLQLLGLTKNEEIVLKAYINVKEAQPSYIASLLSMDKSTVYKITDQLWSKGYLIKNTQKRQTTYLISDIGFLDHQLNAVKSEYAYKFEKISEYIEELKKSAMNGASNTYITVEKGYEAHKREMLRLLDCKEKLIRQKISTGHKMYDAKDYQDFLKNVYMPQRIKKGINIRILMQYSYNDYVRSINRTNREELKEVRILSGEFNNPHSFKIYDDYFDITIYGKEEFPDTIISVHDAYVANMMKEVYDFMWGRSPVYYYDPQLPTRKLFDGTEIPVLGFGTRGLYSKDAYGKEAFLHKNPFYDEVRALDNISYNFSKGITYVDNCQKYGDGLAVKLTAFALRNYPRDRIFHNCKITQMNGLPLVSPQQIVDQCEWYLQQYKTDYIDSLQIHSPVVLKFSISEAIHKIDNLVTAGKVKYISVSNFSITHLEEAQQAAKHPIISNEVLYNYRDRTVEQNGVYEYCLRHNIIVIAFRPLGLGTLCGQEEDPEFAETPLVILAKKYNKTSGQIALNWLLHKKQVIAITKSTNSTHINENVGAIGWNMTKEDYALLDKQ